MTGYIYEQHKARNSYICDVCHGVIEKGEQYYTAIIGGGGLGSIKWPARLHLTCRRRHQERADR
jgi:hypothetical protein